MASKINNRLKRIVQDKTVYEVVRPQAKTLSRYKIKKQAALAEQIMQEVELV